MFLLTDGVGERDLGMVMVFCNPNQARIEACDALSTLHQCDSSEPNMVVVRRYSNTPCIPRGTSYTLYLDVSTFSGGTASAQFPLDRLCFCQLLLFNRTEVLLPCEEKGKKGWRYTPIFQRYYGRIQRRNTIFLIQSPCQSPHQFQLHI